jgi:hypothetical protein
VIIGKKADSVEAGIILYWVHESLMSVEVELGRVVTYFQYHGSFSK